MIPTKTLKNSLPFPTIYDILPLAVEKLQRPRPPDGKVEEASPGFPGPIHGALAQLVARDIRIVEVRGSTPLCSTETLQINVCKVFSLQNL